MYFDRFDSLDKQAGRERFLSLVKPGDVVAITGEPYWFFDMRLIPAILLRRPRKVYVVDVHRTTLEGIQWKCGVDIIHPIHGDIFTFLARALRKGDYLVPTAAWLDIFGHLGEAEWQIVDELMPHTRDLMLTFGISAQRNNGGFYVSTLTNTGEIEDLVASRRLPLKDLRVYGDNRAMMCEMYLSNEGESNDRTRKIGDYNLA